MKKILLTVLMICSVWQAVHGHTPPYINIFAPEWSPVQIWFFPFALTDPEKNVYGVNLVLSGGYQKTVYGVSCGLVQVGNELYGISAGVMTGYQNNYGLMTGAVTACEVNRGVAVGLINCLEPDSWRPAENRVQIGLFNYAKNGLQIGLLNYNPNAWIPWMPLFNYSPIPEQRK